MPRAGPACPGIDVHGGSGAITAPTRTTAPRETPNDQAHADRSIAAWLVDEQDPALGEKWRLGEEKITFVRLAVVAFNALLFLFVTQGPEPVPWLAYTVLGVAAAYSGWLLVAKPYDRFDFLFSSLFVSLADAALITAWLVATGGFGSPYFPLWYVSIVAFSFRYGPWETLGGACLYGVAYGSLALGTGGLVENGPLALLRIGYIFLTGALGSLLSLVALEQTVAKREFRALHERAENQAAVLSSALDATEDGILLVDREGDVVTYNDRFLQMWRIPKRLTEHDDEAMLEHVTDQLEDPQAFRERIEEIYADPHAESFDVLEFEDGRVFERYSKPHYLDGEPIGRVWSFRDVTDQEAMRQRLQESNQRLEHFAYMASHDLREPLRMISGHLSLVEQRLEGTLDEDTRESLAFASDAASRMDELVRGLLAYSRVEREGETFEETTLDAVVDEAIDNLQARIEESDAEVETGELPQVYGDRSQLVQVFQNLIENGLKYNDAEAPRVAIDEVVTDGAHVRVAIEDNGLGIPEDEQAEIFEMFQRGTSGRSTTGSGIGLALCEKIVDRHRGEIELTSSPGEGSTFFLTLPKAQGDQDAGPADPSRDPQPARA